MSEKSVKHIDEHKIIASVWVHERHFNEQTWNDIKQNFMFRLKMSSPMISTLIAWEKRLFSASNHAMWDNITPSDRSSNSKINLSYSYEQKIVAGVWIHEKQYNGLSWDDISQNFYARFNMVSPSKDTLLEWERILFSQHAMWEFADRTGRNSTRFMHIPYVKASIEENPALSIRERSKLLGIPRTTLLYILRNDLKMYFIPSDAKGTDYNTGIWVPSENNLK